jgi:hypothetical protein
MKNISHFGVQPLGALPHKAHSRHPSSSPTMPNEEFGGDMKFQRMVVLAIGFTLSPT